MDRYKSHKIVEAARIVGVMRAEGAGQVDRLQVDDGEPSLLNVTVTADFFARGTPKIGDYLVVYQPDGYLSWSPKAAFEDGYTKIVE